MDVFVTGGSGLVGRRLIARLLAAGIPVTALVRTPASLDGLAGERLRVVDGDVTDRAASTSAGPSTCWPRRMPRGRAA